MNNTRVKSTRHEYLSVVSHVTLRACDVVWVSKLLLSFAMYYLLSSLNYACKKSSENQTKVGRPNLT